jgi:ribonucleoside-diphosphate reductase alpha chain
LKFLPKEAQPPAEAPSITEAKPVALEEKPKTAAKQGGFTAREQEIFQLQADAPACAECGALMVRNGACYKCLNCGSVFGCS